MEWTPPPLMLSAKINSNNEKNLNYFPVGLQQNHSIWKLDLKDISPRSQAPPTPLLLNEGLHGMHPWAWLFIQSHPIN